MSASALPLFRLAVADSHEHVAGLAVDTRTAAFGARRETTLCRRLLDKNARDLELVDVRAVVVFGVGDRRFDCLANDPGRLLLRERQDVQRLVDPLATH